MNKDRLNQLLEFHKDDPNDAFTLYAIATEYKEEEPKTALTYFENLLENHENYVGTYYHVCKLYEQMGEKDLAAKNYIKGLQISQKEQNFHAHAELREAYNKFQGLDYEDEV